MNAPHECLETGEALEKMKMVILDQWIGLVRENVPAATDEDKIILIDHMDRILDNLVLMLKSNKIESQELGKEHGSHRLMMTNFTLQDLLVEYSLLRQTLMDYLYPMGNVHCAQLVHRYIDIISRNSITAFLMRMAEKVRVLEHDLGSEIDELRLVVGVSDGDKAPIEKRDAF